MRRVTAFPITILTSFLAAACAEAPQPAAYSEEAMAPALESITAADILAKTTTLSSDEFQGRAPGTVGEDRTVEYLTNEFKNLGLQPGNPDGTYIQDVPLVGFTEDVSASLTVDGKPMSFEGPRDYIAETRRATPEVKVDNSQIVFVGYGVVAPEYGWDDYKGMDVTGKTLLMLVNDPQIPDGSNKLDDSMFKGRAMTYYGRWTYKYEIAAEKGAAAVLVIHETGPAGYPWEVPSYNWGHEGFDIKSPDNNMSRVPVQGWIRDEMTKKILSAAGQDFDALKKAALSKDFQPVALPAQASFDIRNTLRDVASKNVIAKLEGSDPVEKDQYVVYTAHWDHLGMDTTLVGDQIFNGALDNASGVAALLELADAFTKLDPAPSRSVLFLAVTAEEKGLLGAKYYAENPLYPLDHTLADINMDGVNQWGRTEDMIVVGLGNSTLDDLLTEAAKKEGRVIEPDAEPEKGFFYRSDHFEFAKEGVPALYVDAGTRYIGKPEGYGQAKRDEYTAHDYHQVTDEVKPDWDLAGAVEDTQLLFRVGLRVASMDTWPEWKAGTEFKARRDSMLGGMTN